MKLNKSRLKQMAQSGEVATAPISLKRKKPDEGSSKRVEEAPSCPSVPVLPPPVAPTAAPSTQQDPPVILVDSDFTPPSAASTINQSPLVAMDKAKGAISSQDMDEYAVAHTEDLLLLMVHSVMRVLSFVLCFYAFGFVALFLASNLIVHVGSDGGHGDGPEVCFSRGGSGYP